MHRLLAALALASVAAEPNLLAYKTIAGDVVVGKDMTVTLQVFNIGEEPAYDIEINDNNWGANFEEGTGLTQAKFETLEPGQNITHTYTMTPVASQLHNTAAAGMSYSAAPKDEDKLISYSTTPGMVKILTMADWEVTDSTFLWTQWATFLAMAAVPVALPYALYMMVQVPESNKKKSA